MTEATTLSVNGAARTLISPPERPLIDVLRNELGLRGTRYGCGQEQCGSCMVLVDGEPRYSCGLEVGSVLNQEVTTIEGLGTETNLDPIQQAFLTCQAGQCGYCLSGILLSTKALLSHNPKPTREEIVTALDPHLCRCGAHHRILKAVELASQMLSERTPS